MSLDNWTCQPATGETSPVYAHAILTEVEQMRDGVSDAVDEDEHPSQLVEVDVLIEWQEAAEPSRPQEGDAVSQHQHQHEHTVEVETLTYRQVSFSTDFLSYYIVITNRKQKRRPRN